MKTGSDDAKKLIFAKHLLEKDAYSAAKATFPFDAAKQLEAFNEWVKDDLVVAIIASKEKKENVDLPTKDEFAKTLFDEAKKTHDPYAKEKFYKLFASVAGYMQKPSDITINNQTNNQTNKVMIVYENADPDEWEKNAIEQQEKLQHETIEAS